MFIISKMEWENWNDCKLTNKNISLIYIFIYVYTVSTGIMSDIVNSIAIACECVSLSAFHDGSRNKPQELFALIAIQHTSLANN